MPPTDAYGNTAADLRRMARDYLHGALYHRDRRERDLAIGCLGLARGAIRSARDVDALTSIDRDANILIERARHIPRALDLISARVKIARRGGRQW
jgi:hypothetical protein